MVDAVAEVETPSPLEAFRRPEAHQAWIDGTEVQRETVNHFVRNHYTTPHEDRPNYETLELSVSGADSKWSNALYDDQGIDTLRLYHDKDGNLAKMHVRLVGSTNDVYLAGKALKDYATFHLAEQARASLEEDK